MTNWAIKQKCGNSRAKAVLLSLAYHHNSESGLCCPSTKAIIQDTELDKKTIPAAIRHLEEIGLLSVDRRAKKVSLYSFNLDPKTGQDSDVKGVENLDPKTDKTGPENGHSPKAGQDKNYTRKRTNLDPKTDQDRPENGSGNKELTSNKQGINNSNKLDFSSWPGMPSKQVWEDYKKLRKQKRAPLTQTVIDSLGKSLQILASLGRSVDSVLTECCERGWQGLKPEWILKNQNTGGQPNGQPKPSLLERVVDNCKTVNLDQPETEPYSDGETLDGVCRIIR